TRRVIYSRAGDYLVVIDHVRAPEQVTAHQRWQLGPEVTATLGGRRIELRSGDHHAALAFAGTASTLEEITASDDPFDGWVAMGWKKKAPATAVTATKRGTSFRFITVFATGAGAAPTISTMPIKGAVFSLEVSTGRVTEQIIVHPDDVLFPGDTEEDDPDAPAPQRPEPTATADG